MTRERRIILIVGGGLIAVALVLKLVVWRPPPPVVSPPPAVHHARAAGAAGHHIRAGATAPAVDPTLPAPLRRALARHGVVVAVLYAPGDEGAVATARAGAASAHAGFATLDVRDEAVARAVALKLTGETDPSVLVVTRPGKIALVLSGYAGADVVAQAAAAAR
ncbi:MAG TPA: hypothetical protein VFA05_06295 [Gaiellaceae bacterium]|nr:hypothetical protein [Gaiellaceae bacterium]